MSLTKEDLTAISDLIDEKLNEQEKIFDKKLDDLRTELKEMVIADNTFALEQIQKIESEKTSLYEIHEIKMVTKQNCYDIAGLKFKIS